ncbi:MAG: tetratricopeptide repeat protein [Planctomycetota bacterium]|nr:tetratricopeptide repeat protein [Planctomycetota bacterium]
MVTTSRLPRFTPAGLRFIWPSVLGIALLLAMLAPVQAQQRQMPGPLYYASFASLYEGDYQAALKGFQSQLRGGVRTVQARWIDSICYYTMVGEAHYKLGQLGDAMENYNAALNLYIAYSNWMVPVQFPQTVTAATTRGVVPWGQSKRVTGLAKLRDSTLISQGEPVTEKSLQKGGVISTPKLLPLNVQEIVRCTSLAIYRRREILGPLCKIEPLTDQVTAQLAKRQGQPNHWSEAWIDVQLGMAHAASGNTGEAIAFLQRSLLLNGALDHPVTGLALLELGRIHLEAGKLPEAAALFAEASYTAAEHGDMMVLEEAFKYGFLIHSILNPQQVFAPLESAAAWTKKNGRRELFTSLLLMASESAAQAGNTKQAVTLLAQATASMAKYDMSQCEPGARRHYVAALTNYQMGRVGDGDVAMDLAIKMQAQSSKWLYQLQLTTARLAQSGQTQAGMTTRKAAAIYSRLAVDPLPVDWTVRPLEALAQMTTPRHLIYETWFDSASDMETQVEIADLAKRHRFFLTLPLGGRLMAIRWLLESPVERLDTAGRLQRQEILTRYPKYGELSKQSAELRAKLGNLPLAPDAEQVAESREQSELMQQLLNVSQQQELLIREIAIRREAADINFPPIRKTKEIQNQLVNGQVILHIFRTSRQLHCTLIGKGKYDSWKVANPNLLDKKMVTMLRAIGNYDATRKLPHAQLADTAWKSAARDVIDTLLAGSKVNFSLKFDELIVIPDGSLWYLPFEAVQVGDKANPVALISKTRVRYAPTVGLALTSAVGRAPTPQFAIVVGKLHPQEDPELLESVVKRLERSFPKSAQLHTPLSGPSPLYGSFVDGLVVLDEISNRDGGPYDWSPIQLDKIKSAGSLGQWMSLPWKRADLLVLPAFHTAAENSLKERSGAFPGHELFLSSCGMMSTGARTVLLARWRTGGQTSHELIRQFVQEFPEVPASEAWQRSVKLVSASPLDVSREPRVDVNSSLAPINSDHPFLWAGYMLLDSGVTPQSNETPPEVPEGIKVEEPKADVAAGNADAAKAAAAIGIDGAGKAAPGDVAADDAKLKTDDDPVLQVPKQ